MLWLEDARNRNAKQDVADDGAIAHRRFFGTLKQSQRPTRGTVEHHQASRPVADKGGVHDTWVRQ